VTGQVGNIVNGRCLFVQVQMPVHFDLTFAGKCLQQPRLHKHFCCNPVSIIKPLNQTEVSPIK